MNDKVRYLVAGTKPWCKRVFSDLAARSNLFTFVSDKAQLEQFFETGCPRYVFFLHWNWRVPTRLLRQSECVCFHMTDVPYGRGGSPLQNLIMRGHAFTKLSAIRMDETLDGGPVYAKCDLSLEGSARQIFERVAEISERMILSMVADEPEPSPQLGDITIFERRSPEQSRIPEDVSIGKIYDQIRMLDAESYPPAFLDYGVLRFTFGNARLEGSRLLAEVQVVVRQLSGGE